MTSKLSLIKKLPQVNEDPSLFVRNKIVEDIKKYLSPLLEDAYLKEYKESLLSKDSENSFSILTNLNDCAKNGLEKVRQFIILLRSDKYFKNLKINFFEKIDSNFMSCQKEIARDLHDTILQNLTTISYEIQFCQQLLKLDISKAQDEYSSLRNLLIDNKQCINEFPVFHEIKKRNKQLVSNLKEYINKYTSISGIKVQLKVIGEIQSLSCEANNNLYQIIKEGLNNVKNHAYTDQVEVSLSFNEKYLDVYISDKGKGFVMKEVRKNIFGISGMMERAQLINGKLAIHTSLQKGTQITIHLPLI